MALFDKPDLEKLKRDRNYARLIDWADYKKVPDISAAARAIIAADPGGLAEYLYETAEWTRRNSGHSGRRLPRRGIALLRQVTGMAVSLGEPMLDPLAASLRTYGQYGDPDIKTKLLYFSLVFDIFTRMGAPARATVDDLTGDPDPDVRELAVDCLQHIPEDDDWDDDDEDDDDDGDDWDDEDDTAADRG